MMNHHDNITFYGRMDVFLITFACLFISSHLKYISMYLRVRFKLDITIQIYSVFPNFGKHDI